MAVEPVELQPFYRGDDHALQVTVRVQDDTDPLDITGWLFTITLKLSSEMPDAPQLDEQGNRQVLQVRKTAPDNADSQIGIIELLLPHDQTVDLLPVRYQVDIQVEYDRIVQTLVMGRITVLSDVTHDIGGVA